MTTNSSRSSNFYLFYGEDDFSLRRKIDAWKKDFAKKYSADAIVNIIAADLPEQELISQLEQGLSPSLFSSKKMIVARDILPKASQENLAEKLHGIFKNISPDILFVLWQSKGLDKRLAFTKKLLALKPNIIEFSLPHGTQLNAWIKEYAKKLGAEISEAAMEKLAVFLGRDLAEEKKFGGKVVERKEAYNLWQAHSELLKLSSFSQDIQASDVEKLVKPAVPSNVFDLSDQVLAKNTKASIQTLENLLSDLGSDEKSALIKIIGLLAEQLRALVLVGTLAKQGLDQAEIAEQSGFSSGRVFMTLKHARSANLDQLKQLLAKLLIVDLKLKTTDENPLLNLNLFLIQATQ